MLPFLLLLFCTTHCFSLNPFTWNQSADVDRVSFVPGLDKQPQFAVYSGYLAGSTPNIQIHYWLFEAAELPDVAPLLLWLNGGPGCSSLEGALDENGPFMIRPGPRLQANPNSWNKFANVIYLEAPAGVGFSYAVDGNTTTDDDFTSSNNYHALLHFLERFPKYKGRDFFITGESYAGVYVPTLAVRVIEGSLELNLKGVAVGNGLTSYRYNDNSLLYFVNYHGLVDEAMWADALENCCAGQSATKCFFTDTETVGCQNVVYYIQGQVLDGLNIYNLYAPCSGGVNNSSGRSLLYPKEASKLNSQESFTHTDFGNLFRTNALRIMERSTVNLLRQSVATSLAIPCVDDTVIESYLNLDPVRKALHVDVAQVDRWEVCSDQVNRNYVRTYKDLSAQYIRILNSKIRVLLYSGDVDMACNYFGNLWFVDSLPATLKQPLRRWLYTEEDGTLQVGGFHKLLYLNGTHLWYMTIRGSGHMVPHDKPVPAFHMMRSFTQSEWLQ
ncbi:unnamed protein product [Calicophoron daubneyi]|uniref:Carboxypeptidase n=1 Tax=Calicophoron daubneyi TaxID=300641 RepID=A0AAV2TDM9_CALDB